MLLLVEEPSPMSCNMAMFGTQPRNRTHQKTRRFSGFPFTSQRPFGGVHKKLGSPRSPIARATTLPTRSCSTLCKELTSGVLASQFAAMSPASADEGARHIKCNASSPNCSPHCPPSIQPSPIACGYLILHGLQQASSHACGEAMRLLAGHCET